MKQGRWLSHLPLALVWVATIACFAWIFELGFTDTDALADVAAARVDSFSDFGRQLGIPLTDGVAGKNANFWRPTTMVQFAFLRGVFGWSAWGWHFWDLLLHLTCIGLVYALALSQSRKAATVAAALFAFHPLTIEVVPAVARSIDSLMTALVLLCIWLAGRGRWRGALICGALALGAKEGAVVGLPLAIVYALFRDQTRTAKALFWGFSGVLVIFLLLRGEVLEGLGGYYESNLIHFGRLESALKVAPWELIAPGWSGVLGDMPSLLRFLSAGMIWIGCGIWVWKKARQQPLLLVGFGLIALSVGLFGVTGTYSRRLLYLPTAGLAFMTGAALSTRWGGAVLVLWFVSLLPASPLVHRDSSWQHNDALTDAMTWQLESTYVQLEPGTTIWMVDRPHRVDGSVYRQRLWTRGATLNNSVAGYSIQAWADDRFGEGTLRFETVSFSRPVGNFPTAKVRIDGESVVVTRPWVRRYRNLKAKVWQRTIENHEMHLVPDRSLRGDYLLVVGTPRSTLVGLK